MGTRSGPATPTSPTGACCWPHRSGCASAPGISAFIVPMDTPGIVQRPLKMISGITTEFGQVTFDDVRVPAGNIVGQPGDGWAMAMTVVGHEREPSTLGYVARYAKTVQSLVARTDEPTDELALAAVETEMLRLRAAPAVRTARRRLTYPRRARSTNC